jgi:N-acetylglucosaminyldiphosphoundecaprenol N-acetyl-beta-D-mannosaminyltransferase
MVDRLPIQRMNMSEIVAVAARHLRQQSSLSGLRATLHIFGVNAQIANLVKENGRFANAMLTGDILYADGASIVLASWLLGSPISERVPGGELMEAICKEAAKDRLSIYLLGGLPGAALKASQLLLTRYPGLSIAGTCCPSFGFENRPEESRQVVDAIREARPDILVVCLGAPKQEIWAAENSHSLGVSLVFPGGAVFDTLAGFRRRAPYWARNTGTEWLYRLVMEPKRLWRRYLLGNPRFLWLVCLFWLSKRQAEKPIDRNLRAQGEAKT